MPDIDPVSFVLALLPYPLMKGRTIADFKIHGWSWQFAAPHWPMQILQAQSRRLHAEIEGCVPLAVGPSWKVDQFARRSPGRIRNCEIELLQVSGFHSRIQIGFANLGKSVRTSGERLPTTPLCATSGFSRSPGNVSLHLPLFHNGFCRRLVLLRSAAAPGAAAAAAGRRLSARHLLVFERVISLDKCPVGCGVFLVNLGELSQHPNFLSRRVQDGFGAWGKSCMHEIECCRLPIV